MTNKNITKEKQTLTKPNTTIPMLTSYEINNVELIIENHDRWKRETTIPKELGLEESHDKNRKGK